MNRPEGCSDNVHEVNPVTKTDAQPAFLPDDAARSEESRGRPHAWLARMSVFPGVTFGRCSTCDRLDVLQKSGLVGWTCIPCELDIDENLLPKETIK